MAPPPVFSESKKWRLCGPPCDSGTHPDNLPNPTLCDDLPSFHDARRKHLCFGIAMKSASTSGSPEHGMRLPACARLRNRLFAAAATNGCPSVSESILLDNKRKPRPSGRGSLKQDSNYSGFIPIPSIIFFCSAVQVPDMSPCCISSFLLAYISLVVWNCFTLA